MTAPDQASTRPVLDQGVPAVPPMHASELVGQHAFGGRN
jgi:hypothetical protein